MAQTLPEVPSNLDPTLRRYLSQVRAVILNMQTSVVAPTPVTNLRATAKAGGVIIQFTRSDGDAYVLYWNSTPTISGAARIDLGLAAEYVDEIGAGAITRHYWVKTKRGQMESYVTGPVTATSLALNVPITPPVPPPPTIYPIRSDEGDWNEVGIPGPSYERF